MATFTKTTIQGVTNTNTTETTDVGFVDLGIGDSVTIGGLTATATATVLAAVVATAFVNKISNPPTAATTGLSFTGTFTGGFTAAVSNGNHVIFTSTTADTNVTDLAAAFNLAPIITAPTSVTGNEDTVIPIVLTATDVDGSVANFKINSLPNNGILYSDSNLTTVVTVSPAVISATLNNLNLYFKPNANWNGTTAFNYVAVDNNNAESTPATQNINVNPVPDAPTIGLPPISSIAITQGTVSTHETAVVTFLPLAKGHSFAIGGFNVFAINDATAQDVADIFANVSSTSTTVLPTSITPKQTTNLVLNRFPDAYFTNQLRYSTTSSSSSTVTFTNDNLGNTPDLMLMGSGFDVSLTETQAITNTPTTGTFSISGVNSSDTITVEVEENVTASGTGTNAIALANLLNNRNGTSTGSYNNLIHSFKLGDDSGHVVVNNSTPTVAWSFDSSQHIPNFASLLNGESITLTYNVTAENSGEIAHKSVNFIIQGQTKIISAAVFSATQDIPGGAIQVETENGTHIRLIDSVSGADVTDKFDMMPPDLNAGIKTFTFQLRYGIGYNGQSLVAESFLDSNNSFTNSMAIPGFNAPDGVEFYAGTNGSDTITGSSGADTLSGGMGNDTYIISDATNVVFETNIGGIDTIQSSVNFKLPRNVENLVLTGGSGLIGNGNNLANHITGSSGSDTLDGGAGSDVMTGGAGDDVYVIDRLTDVVDETSGGSVNGGAGIDTINSFITYSLTDTTHILGSVENLTLTGLSAIDGTGNTLPNKIVGNDAANSISGGESADTLNGGNGNDTLVGGAGSDVLTGGAGVDTLTGENSAGGTDTFVDTFKFDSITDMGIATRRDVITDFQTGTDKIDLRSFVTATATAAPVTFNLTGANGTASFTTTANQIRWSFYGNGITNPYYAVVQGNTDTNPATVEFEIKLNGVIALVPADFILA